ncbi:MAG: 4-hydroxy-tetrahydrodipicolinate reductase [Chloroflexi bacterium]|nr:4-hydroxy-tetrahydrodipicolinate reductase [Chloroflexota bacterium]
MEPIKVIVHGALGRVGREMVNSLCRQNDIRLVGAADRKASGDSLILPDNLGTIPFYADLDRLITACKPDVMVDFTVAKATMPAVRIASQRGVHLVIGTTGLAASEIDDIDQIAKTHHVGAVIAPNFALGAVLMVHLAKIAAKYLDYAEIIELHHHLKLDAPSGTSLSTARAMVQSRGKPFVRPGEAEQTQNSRREQIDGITIHSVRLPGLMAHQEIIFGAMGQTLSIRHDTINRECYVPGVILAIKEVVKRQGLVYGLDILLNLQETK